MALPWEKAKQEQSTQSGMEKMLRSMGLGEVLDMAKQLANAGTAQKIIAFADNLEPLMQRLQRMEEQLGRIEDRGYLIENAIIDGFEPHSSSRGMGLEQLSTGGLVRQPVTGGDISRPSGNGALHTDDGDVHSGTET